MKISLEALTNGEQEKAAARVRCEVFGTEWAIKPGRMASAELPGANHVIARLLPENEVIATVTVLDTTGDSALHKRYEIPFGRTARVARYTQMAVLKPYRGLNLPLYMLLYARQLYIVPGGFTYTWLLFREDRAMSSKFCSTLGFSASSQVVQGEQGASRVLTRYETGRGAETADTQARSFLDAVRPKELQVITFSEAFTPAAAELELCSL